jgi:hypothetical protein
VVALTMMVGIRRVASVLLTDNAQEHAPHTLGNSLATS